MTFWQLSTSMPSVLGPRRPFTALGMVMLTPSTQLPDVAVVPPDPDVRRGLAVLYRLLDRVKPRHRMAFVLRDVLGMEMPEVAAALELSDTAARRALTEGRKRVLRLAGQCANQPQDTILADEYGPLVMGSSARPIEPIALVRALVPASDGSVPAVQEAQQLMYWLPLPTQRR